MVEECPPTITQPHSIQVLKNNGSQATIVVSFASGAMRFSHAYHGIFVMAWVDLLWTAGESVLEDCCCRCSCSLVPFRASSISKLD